MTKRRILLTGASGLLGERVLPGLRTLGEVHDPSLEEFDLLKPETVRRVFDSVRPDLVVHLAAETRVDRCETHPGETFRINTGGTEQVAEACRSLGARLVFMSTDYVFDGRAKIPYREDRPTGALNVYGRSKEEAESAVLSIVADRLVVRSASLFGHGARHFVAGVLDQARRGNPLRIVDDQTQSPTFVGHLAPAMVRAIGSDLGGILHLAGRGGCTWFEFGLAILSRAGLSVSCEPISSEELKRPAARPAYSILDTGLAEETLGIRMPTWQEGLTAFFEEGPA
jgi:dTDP-4-dehydrorhamnose reductase